MSINKIQSVIEQYQRAMEAQQQQQKEAETQQHELDVCEFAESFKADFNVYFKDLFTFNDFVGFMNERGWDVTFNVEDFTDFMYRSVVFTPLQPINDEDEIIVMSVSKSSPNDMIQIGETWVFNKMSKIRLKDTKPQEAIHWLTQNVGYPKAKKAVTPSKPDNPKHNLPCNVLATDMTLLDYYAGKALHALITKGDYRNRGNLAYELAETMIAARQAYFDK